ncbi:YgfZ/GcvT domain-containing protein [Seongchinamella sediminis]|uniref:CAF17-like 4Fe-4S cluster assembly/insertion protein YgfZ n=1 Tax=Seongchinamella sediminis TaxID=2283635 RepID=UPI0013C2F887|nr:folate-binding protein YgfZ [Seongchinamella sediminis]
MSACYAPLQAEAILHITGPDSLTFLQGQTTCDTRKISSTQALPGAYCNVQGRMVCDFLLLQLAQEHYALRLKADTLDNAAATFGKYIVFSKAELAGGSGDWQLYGCWGEAVADALRSLGMSTPTARYGAATGDGHVLVQMDDAGCQFELYIDGAATPELAGALEAALERCPETQWQALQMRAGIGRVEGPNVAEMLPQMLNYDVTGHVSFSKGCYTGQEIVARLHYRGKAKRRMYLGELPGGAASQAGDSLFSPGSGQGAGTVINAAQLDDRTVCLVTATEQGAAGGLRLASPDGPAIELQPLPYTVDEAG